MSASLRTGTPEGGLRSPVTPWVSPPAPRRAGGRRSRAAVAERLWLGVLLLTVALVQGWNAAGFPSFADDEGTYLSQAWSVDHGAGLSPYTYWYDHPPAGWLQLALLQWLPEHLYGGAAVAGGRLILVAVAVVNAGLLYVLARRIGLHAVTASVAVVLFTMTPLALQFEHRIFLDNLAVMWLLAAFVLATSPRQHLGLFGLAGVFAGMTILTKETMLLALPGLALTLYQRIPRETRAWCWTASAIGLVGVAFTYPLYAMLQHELLPGAGHVSLWDGVRFQLASRAGSGSVLDAASAAHQLVTWWLSTDPVLIMAGSVALLVTLLIRRLRGPAVSGLVLTVAALRPGGYLPAMYVIGLLPFYALSISGAGEHLVTAVVRALRGRGRLVRVQVAIVASAAGLAVLAAVLPPMVRSDSHALTSDVNTGYADAVDWMARHAAVGPDTRIVSDNTVWLDLVQRHVAPEAHVLWLYKVDLDPAVRATLPQGWRDITYVVSTPEVRSNSSLLPLVAAAMAHSVVIASFGTAGDRVDVLQVRQEESG